MKFLKKIFNKKSGEADSSDPSEEEAAAFYEEKSALIEKILGNSAGVVGHAIIPFSVGGAVDMYYYPNHIEGTAFATQELVDLGGRMPKENRLGFYELVAFTKRPYEVQESVGEGDFGKIERRVCGTFTFIGQYSYEAVLQPGETCELPYEDEPHRYLVFDTYNPQDTEYKLNNAPFGLLLVIEVFESEMHFAMENGSAELFKLLKSNGCYPYSDLQRDPVV